MTEVEAVMMLRMIQSIMGTALLKKPEDGKEINGETVDMLFKKFNEAIDMACISLTHDAIEIAKDDGGK